MRVLFVYGLEQKLFSIESFISNNKYKVLYDHGRVKLIFYYINGNGHVRIVTTNMPHVSLVTYISREAHNIRRAGEQGFWTYSHPQARSNQVFKEVNFDHTSSSHYVAIARELNEKEEITEEK